MLKSRLVHQAIRFLEFRYFQPQSIVGVTCHYQNHIREKMAFAEGKSLESVERALNNWLKPQVLGEGWDNIGLLVGSGKFEKSEKVINSVMLCNDLLPKVLDEAIEKNVNLIVAYHPPIFSGMKSVSYGTWKERIVARSLAHDICIYSPHTTLDSTVGGINDRVLNALRKGSNAASQMRSIIPSKCLDNECLSVTISARPENVSKVFEKVPFEGLPGLLLSLKVESDNTASLSMFGRPDDLDRAMKLIGELDMPELGEVERKEGTACFGAGRIVDLVEPLDLDEAVDMLKAHLGLPYVQLAYGGNPKIKSAAVCVGSGSSLLKPIAGKVDLLITGEMSHHDILECVVAKSSVVLCNHCSSERHYLPDLANILKVVTGLDNIFVSEEDASPLRLVL